MSWTKELKLQSIHSLLLMLSFLIFLFFCFFQQLTIFSSLSLIPHSFANSNTLSNLLQSLTIAFTLTRLHRIIHTNRLTSVTRAVTMFVSSDFILSLRLSLKSLILTFLNFPDRQYPYHFYSNLQISQNSFIKNVRFFT